MSRVVAYPVDNPFGQHGSAANNGNFVNISGRDRRADADRFHPDLTFISSGAAVIRGGSETPPATTRGSVA